MAFSFFFVSVVGHSYVFISFLDFWHDFFSFPKRFFFFLVRGVPFFVPFSHR